MVPCNRCNRVRCQRLEAIAMVMQKEVTQWCRKWHLKPRCTRCHSPWHRLFECMIKNPEDPLENDFALNVLQQMIHEKGEYSAQAKKDYAYWFERGSMHSHATIINVSCIVIISDGVYVEMCVCGDVHVYVCGDVYVEMHIHICGDVHAYVEM